MSIKLLILVNDVDNNKNNLDFGESYSIDDFRIELDYAYSLDEALHLLDNDDYQIIWFHTYKWGCKISNTKSDEEILNTIRDLRKKGYKGGLMIVSPSIHSFHRLLKMYPIPKYVDSLCDSFLVFNNLKGICLHCILRSIARKEGKQLREAVYLVSKSIDELVSEAILTVNDFKGFKIVEEIEPLLREQKNEIKMSSSLLDESLIRDFID